MSANVMGLARSTADADMHDQHGTPPRARDETQAAPAPVAPADAVEGLRMAIVSKLGGQTTWSRDCTLSGEYLTALIWDDVLAALTEARAKVEEAERSETALDKINTIRNSIIGLQTMNWSEHIYPLVAALEGAGIHGMEYPEARENFGTMLDRTNAAEAALEAAQAQIAGLRAVLTDVKDNGLIYWEPNTDRGGVNRALMLARIEAALASLPAPGAGRMPWLSRRELGKGIRKAFPDLTQDEAEASAETVWQACLLLPSAPEAGDGWRLVPVDPTPEMLDAAVKGSRADVSYADVEELWPAMLAAAPPPAIKRRAERAGRRGGVRL